MKALVHNNRVCQICKEEFPVAGDLSWVDCDESVEVEDQYIGGRFVKKQKQQISRKEAERNKMPALIDQIEIICQALSDLDPAGSALKQEAKDLIAQHLKAKSL